MQAIIEMTPEAAVVQAMKSVQDAANTAWDDLSGAKAVGGSAILRAVNEAVEVILDRLEAANPILPTPEPSAGMKRAVEIVEGLKASYHEALKFSDEYYDPMSFYLNSYMVAVFEKVLDAFSADARPDTGRMRS